MMKKEEESFAEKKVYTEFREVFDLRLIKCFLTKGVILYMYL